jgi:8-oxo-dGTP pyrophosphatase MutT (NUDIX family)
MPEVVTVFLEHDDKILLLKRSSRVKTYKGYWAGISGYVEKGEDPLQTAIKEIREETALKDSDVEFLHRLPPFKFTDEYAGELFEWTIHIFLFHSKTREITIDWEHVDYNWVSPSIIASYKTVPKLQEAIKLITRF